MDPIYDNVEDSRPNDSLDYAVDLSDTEFAFEIKPFQVEALIQEAEQAALDFSALQLDEALLTA